MSKEKVDIFIIHIAQPSRSLNIFAMAIELKSSSNNPSIPTSIHIQKQRLGLESSGKSSSFLEYETSCIALTKEMQWLLRTSSTLINTDEVTSEYEYPVGTLPPNLIRKFPMIMKAWAQRCSIPHLRSNAAHVVERLLERLLAERDAGNLAVDEEEIINTQLYNLVIEAWANTSGNVDAIGSGSAERRDSSHDRNNGNKAKVTKVIIAAQRAQDILKTMEELAFSGGVSAVKPDIKSYHLTLKAWVRSREHYAVDKMEDILNCMEGLGAVKDSDNASTLLDMDMNTVSKDVKMIARCYNFYLYALANRRTKYNAKLDAKKAYAILLGLKARSSLEIGALAFDTNTYNQVLSTFAKKQNFEGASEAQVIFDEMMNESNVTHVYPDTNTFNTVMNCWLKSGWRGRQHVEKLLHTMVTLNKEGHEGACPDRFSVNSAISAVAKSGRKDSVRKAHFMLMNMEELYGVTPDTASFNLLLGAYAKSRDLQAGKKATKLLVKMEDLFKKGNRDVVPDSFTYSTVIDTINNPSKAEKVLNRMRYLNEFHGGREPNIVVYNALLNKYSTCGDEVLRCQDLLQYMEECYNSGTKKMKPTIISYNTVLKAYSHARGEFTKDANELLSRLETMYKSGESDVAPDVISYTTVISSYSRSDCPQKAREAKNVLDRMINSYNHGNKAARPSIYSFNSCLNACAYTCNQNEKVDAFVVAVSILAQLQEWTKPDHTTYGTMLKALCNLIPEDDERRHRIVNSMFRQCCKEGQVGSMVLQQLRYAASHSLYKTLVGRPITEHDQVTLCNLPTRWSRNVKERNGKILR
eukprot:CAMPEP_0194089756 /NCGR_PEP_ID=MMETSP0149-20130528/36111_1 /TAXON_ID=122233 /ORGANISM="Chaetoceros debilis, Strain MM31A-1" /LENGTH=808 /DNA_ID=CAMNT_0038773811 /DNA_START=384 /DNA_END=2811 /DNA_ORIENTATION=+